LIVLIFLTNDLLQKIWEGLTSPAILAISCRRHVKKGEDVDKLSEPEDTMDPAVIVN
jgi:hypothetical protein